jgi:glutamate dehydrogenase
LIAAAREAPTIEHYDRLALERAIDGIATAHRALTSEAVATGLQGEEAVRVWSEERRAEVNRIRTAVEGIAASGLTVSKASVAANLLGDLTRI